MESERTAPTIDQHFSTPTPPRIRALWHGMLDAARSFRAEIAAGAAAGGFGAVVFLVYFKTIVENVLICTAAAGLLYFGGRYFVRAHRRTQ